MQNTKKAWVNFLFLTITLVINMLGALGAINGLTQKEISDMFLTLITPISSTFRIWGIIYLLLIVSIITMIIKKKDSYYQKAVQKLTVQFRLSCVLNSAWIIAFSYVQLALSVLFIFGLVITLALICKQLLMIQENGRWLLPLSFGMYMGWVFIATVVNISAALIKLQWTGFGLSDEIWAFIILIVAVILVIAVQSDLRNAVVPLPVSWAYFGIYQFLKSPQGFDGQYNLLQNVSLAAMAILIVAATIQYYKNRFSLLPSLKNK